MRALVLSDIHGNLHALEAVLGAAQASAGEGFDQLWNLGDVVGYGARPNEVIEILRALATVNVRGNHDRVCSGVSSSIGFNPVAAAAAGWTRTELRSDNREWLREMPRGPLMPADQVGERAMCAHGSPLHEDQYISSMRDAWTPLQRMETEITFFGHTHVQGGFKSTTESFVMEVPAGSRHLINPGSVGQPRDHDWRAAFAIYDDLLEQVTFFRTPYDLAAAQAAIRAAKLPERLAARLKTGE
jgi:diadenosine tetraphosphatase ApaH/serine/threonine PP2A family protein phosphatase